MPKMTLPMPKMTMRMPKMTTLLVTPTSMTRFTPMRFLRRRLEMTRGATLLQGAGVSRWEVSTVI